MGAGASLDASSVLTKEEAKAIAGDQWDEAKWEAAEKDEAGAVRAELLIAHIAAATVARPDEFSGLGEEARKRAAKTRAKELKAEISKWSEDFEENQGRKPSEEDKVAIKDKVDLFKHYKAMYQAKAPHGDDSKQPAAKVSSVKPSDDESSPRPALVPTTDEFSGLGEEARKRAAKTRAKELKAEISKWSEDFEENQGRKPSEEDKVAIKDKVDLFKHYKAMYQAKTPHGDDSKQPAAKVSSVKPSDDESSPRPARADAGAASARALTSPHAIQASPDASMMEVREEINADADAPEAVAYPDPDPDPDPDARTALVDYADKASLLRVARQGYVQLVSPQLFIDCHEEGRPLPRCQDVASEYVLGARPLADERTEIIAVSYCWISPRHPDPDGYHVETLCHMLRKFLSGRYDESEREMDYHMPESEIVPTAWWLRDQGFSFGAGDGRPVAVFFDYVSLPQTPRSQDDDIVMDKGLQNINVWYAHAHTTTWMLTSLPPGTMRKSYDSSGWTCFEWCIGGVVSSQDKLLRIDEVAREELVSGAWNDEEFDYLQVALVTMDARGPPLTPDDFARIVQGKVFTNKADCEKIVIPKYRATFDDVIVGAQQLNYAVSLDAVAAFCLLFNVLNLFCGSLAQINGPSIIKLRGCAFATRTHSCYYT